MLEQAQSPPSPDYTPKEKEEEQLDLNNLTTVLYDSLEVNKLRVGTLVSQGKTTDTYHFQNKLGYTQEYHLQIQFNHFEIFKGENHFPAIRIEATNQKLNQNFVYFESKDIKDYFNEGLVTIPLSRFSAYLIRIVWDPKQLEQNTLYKIAVYSKNHNQVPEEMPRIFEIRQNAVENTQQADKQELLRNFNFYLDLKNQENNKLDYQLVGITSCGGDIDSVLVRQFEQNQPQPKYGPITSLSAKENPMSRLSYHLMTQSNNVLQAVEKRNCHFYFDIFSRSESAITREYEVITKEFNSETQKETENENKQQSQNPKGTNSEDQISKKKQYMKVIYKTFKTSQEVKYFTGQDQQSLTQDSQNGHKFQVSLQDLHRGKDTQLVNYFILGYDYESMIMKQRCGIENKLLSFYEDFTWTQFDNHGSFSSGYFQEQIKAKNALLMLGHIDFGNSNDQEHESNFMNLFQARYKYPELDQRLEGVEDLQLVVMSKTVYMDRNRKHEFANYQIFGEPVMYVSNFYQVYKFWIHLAAYVTAFIIILLIIRKACVSRKVEKIEVKSPGRRGIYGKNTSFEL